ncbi:MAG TPA: hypothetical protein VLA93_19775 [Pyrinomonadaceae bacterium]|nr:hypothetical protein [Pyrinomonadaceae bacterium]
MTGLFSNIVALTSILALVLTLPGALKFRSTPSPVSLNLKSESQLRSESTLYETAIREIGTIANMKLTTPEALKKANDIVAKHIRNLKYGPSKFVVLALSDGVFANAVKARTKDEKSAEDFLLEIGKDPNAILKLAGADSLKSRVQGALEADTKTLQGIAQQLKRSADEIKAASKQHHSTVYSPNRFDLTNAIGRAVDLVIVASFLINPALGVVVTANVVPVAIATVLIARLVTNIGTEEGRNKVAACMDAIDQKYQDCLAAAAQIPLGFGIAAAAICYGDWLLAAANCQLIA